MRKKKRGGLKIIALVVLALFVVFFFKERDLNAKKMELELKKQEKTAALVEEKERTRELENRKAYMQTTKYIEELARKKLGLVYPDEIIFKEENSDK